VTGRLQLLRRPIEPSCPANQRPRTLSRDNHGGPPDARAAGVPTGSATISPSGAQSKREGPTVLRAWSHAMYWPPFAVSVEPVMNPASSLARNTTQRATSSGSPRRPTGISGRILVFSTSSGTARTISVPI
jgi:hypothetical protein